MKQLNQEYIDYINSPEWKIRRKKFLIEMKDKNELFCALCMQTNQALFQVHHRSYATFKNEDSKHLIILCTFCHNAYHKGKDLKREIAKTTPKKKVKSQPKDKKGLMLLSTLGSLASYNARTIEINFPTGTQMYNGWITYIMESSSRRNKHYSVIMQNREDFIQRCNKMVTKRQQLI